MKDSDRILLDGLRATVCADVPQEQWDLVVKATEDAGDVRLVDGYAGTMLHDAIEKAKKKRNKIQTVMGEFKEGKLESSSGEKVTSPKQAIAIALSEQRRAKKKIKKSDAEVEKGRFSSRSEAARYAANMRWRGAGTDAEIQAAHEARMAGNARRSESARHAANTRWHGSAYSDNAKKPFLDLTDVDPQGKMEAGAKPAKAPKESASPEIVKRIKEGDLSEIADVIRRDLRAQGKKVPFGAQPYLDAMSSLGSITDKYFEDSGSSIVAYLLSNLTSYKGATAREVKAELNRRFKEEMRKA